MNQVEVKRRQIQSFSYVLACINIWVFGKSIGDNGLGYLAAAVLVFALFWVLTGKNLPDRMGRMLRGRNARGQYRNVSRMRKNMMLFQIAEGLLGTVLCMSLGWILLEKVFLVPYGSMILWILSPALFLRCIQSVFLGYFQSEGSEMPSAVSSVLRHVFFLGLGLVFLGIFRNYGEKVSLLLKRADFTSMYGAMGIAVGMLLSEVLVLLFVFVIYRGSMAGRREAESGMKGTDSFSLQLRTLLIPMGGDTAFVDRPAFLPEKIDGYLCIRFCVWYFRRQISDHDPDARSNFKCGNSAGGGQNRQPYPQKRRKICQNCISGRSTGDGGTWILFHGRDRSTGNTTVTGFG